jgi:hypothetical protein
MSQVTANEADVNALFDEARVPNSVKGAAAAVAGAGLAVALMGVQNLLLVHWLGVWMLIPFVLLALGSAGIAVGAKLLHARRWSLKAGVAASIVLILTSLGFLVLGFLSGVFSMFSLLGLGAGVAALVLTILAMSPFSRLMTTRLKLKQAGFDLDL